MSADPAETPTVVKVAEGFYVRQAVDNIAWMDMGRHVLVVDALEQRELEEEVFGAICSTLGQKPVRYLLNTHTHYDHVALNAAFQSRFGTEIINLRTIAAEPDGRWFRGDGRSAQMLPAPGVHSGQDCLVWVPEDKALFVGDLFGWGLVPLSGRLGRESAALLLETYARMIAFDAAVVIPGHGPLCSTAELKRWVEYFHWLCGRVAEACRAGESDAQIRSRIAPPAEMASWWRFLEWKHQDSLSKVLQAVRGGWQPDQV